MKRAESRDLPSLGAWGARTRLMLIRVSPNQATAITLRLGSFPRLVVPTRVGTTQADEQSSPAQKRNPNKGGMSLAAASLDRDSGAVGIEAGGTYPGTRSEFL